MEKRINRESTEEKKNGLPKELRQGNIDAAGKDIGSDRHMVAVPEGRDEISVREFGAFTTELHDLAQWLKRCGIKTIAMESTGVYWIPLYEILDRQGFKVNLVDARHVKNVS